MSTATAHHAAQAKQQGGCPSTTSHTASLCALVTVMAPLGVLFAMLLPASESATQYGPQAPSCHWQRTGYTPESTEYPLQTVGTGSAAWQVWCPVACDTSLNPEAPACSIPPQPAN